jgi:hypothetical protein
VQWRRKSPIELIFTFDFHGRFQTDVNGVSYRGDLDSLRAKLAQFPSGTEFHVSGFGPQDHLALLWQAIEDTADEHGLVLEFDKAR